MLGGMPVNGEFEPHLRPPLLKAKIVYPQSSVMVGFIWPSTPSACSLVFNNVTHVDYSAMIPVC